MNNVFTMNSSLQAIKKLAVCAALVCVCAGVFAQNKVFDELAKMKGVDYTHVDKNMIKVAAKQGKGLHVGEVVNLGEGEGEEFLDQFNDVKVFTCEEGGDVKKFQKTAMKLLKGKEWEPLIDTKGEDGEVIKIYLSKNGEQSTNVILAVQDDEAHLVVISGTFDFAKMLQQGMNMNIGINN